MNIELLQKVQDKQIEMMDIIHDICVNNSIEYYIIGGTALGAVRHGGFISWDFDIDIAMSRVNYDKFISLAKEKLPNNLTCHYYKNEKDYFPPHALVSLNNSVLIQKDDYLNPTLKRYGIFIDIFPLDIAPNDKKLQEKQAKKIKKIKLSKTIKKAISYSQNGFLKRFIKKLYSLKYLFVSVEKLNERLDKEMRRYESQFDNDNWCSMASHYSYKKQCMPKEIYGTPTLIDFAGRKYFAPQNLDEYLKRIYGDYMKLPSKEQQIAQMEYFIHAEW